MVHHDKVKVIFELHSDTVMPGNIQSTDLVWHEKVVGTRQQCANLSHTCHILLKIGIVQYRSDVSCFTQQSC